MTKILIHWYKHTALHIAFITLFLMLTRCLFYAYNASEWANSTTAAIQNALYGGIFFDITFAVIFTLMFVFLHLLLYTFSEKIYDKAQPFVHFFYVVSGLLMVCFTFLDISTYAAFRHHIRNADLPLILGCYGVILQLKYIVPILMGWVGISCFFYQIYKKTIENSIKKSNENTFLKRCRLLFFAAIATFISVFIGFTSSFIQVTPIRATDFADATCLPLVVNSPYLFLYNAIKKTDNITKKSYFSDDFITKNYPLRYNLPHTPNGKNVVVILIESLSRENVDERYAVRPATPFMDSIRTKSWVFDNAFSNGLSSNEGVASVIAGIPPLLNCDYAQSPYIYNKIQTIAHKLRANGYNTSFLSGWRNLGYTTGRAPQLFGMQTVLDGEALADTDDTEAMGLYDTDFMPKAAKHLKTQKQPFYSVVFNVSTHYNYKFIDPKHQFKHLNTNDLTNNKAVTYFDSALQQFFESYKKDSLRFKNTIFVFVADHHSRTTHDVEKSSIAVHKIPLWIYAPDGSLPAQHDNRLVEQIDLPVSILKILGVGGKFSSFGQPFYPITAPTLPRYTVNKKDFVYQIADLEYVLRYDGLLEKNIALYNYTIDKTLKDNILDKNFMLAQTMQTALKVHIQRFNNTIIDNNF